MTVEETVKTAEVLFESEFQTAERYNLPGSDYSTSPPSLEICPLLAWLLLLPPGTSRQTENMREIERALTISGNTRHVTVYFKKKQSHLSRDSED